MRTLLIDDERLARRELRRLLAQHPEVTIVGEAAHVAQAQAAIAEHRPDLLFLDVQMPGKTGFDLLAELDAPPAVIFTTAYDQYALQAFEVSALDYLLKPIDPARLAAALAKVTPPTEPPPTATDVLTSEDRVFVKDGQRYWFVRLSEVRLFESEGNYTRLYLPDGKPLVYRSLSTLEARLDPKAFFRASRKHLLNLRWVTGFDSWFNGGLLAHLDGAPDVELSRRQAQAFRERMSL